MPVNHPAGAGQYVFFSVSTSGTKKALIPLLNDSSMQKLTKFVIYDLPSELRQFEKTFTNKRSLLVTKILKVEN